MACSATRSSRRPASGRRGREPPDLLRSGRGDHMPSMPAQLRALLHAPSMVTAPGAYDAITARVIAQAGFPAVYMTGAGTSASLGYPDFGLVTLTEMVANAARIVRAAEAPLIADA